MDALRALRQAAAEQPVLDTVIGAARAVLGTAGADVDADAQFTDLGGDSLSALTFSTLLAELLGVEVSVGVIVSPASDLSQIADSIEAERRSGSTRPTFAKIHGKGETTVYASDLTLDKFIDTAVGVGRAGRGGHSQRAQRHRRRRPWPARGCHRRQWHRLGLGVEARSRALLTEGEAAERLYREAIQRLDRTSIRTELARAHLIYGEWLRRERRRGDARDQLRIAHHLFEAMGMEAFAERARRELKATGESARKPSVPTSDHQLTAQEAQIARMAREGLSNPEIGARLFLSARTVQYHLKKVFIKLGIESRTQLDRVLSD